MPFSDAQAQKIAEDIAEQAVVRFIAANPDAAWLKAEIPAPLKWAALVISALFTAGVAGMAFWLVTTVSSMQVTLARMDERQSGQSSALDGRFSEFDRRLTKIEATLPERPIP